MQERGMSEVFQDVRMKGFGSKTPVTDVLGLLDARTNQLDSESVSIAEAAGRVLAEDVASQVDVPSFRRAAMDGYAVRAADSGPLSIIGESLPARPFAGTLGAGQAVRIMTGAPMPHGADAVLKAETAGELDGRVEILEPVSPGKNIGLIGEDVACGNRVLSVGRVLRPQDIGLLASIGVAEVTVVRRPRVAILATGDELLPPGSAPENYRIVDSNSPMLAALVQRDGGIVISIQYVQDSFHMLRAALQSADADLILVSGGSSLGSEDHAPRAVAGLGELPIHGIAMKPGGPTGIGFIHGKPVFLLPGNPVSCLCAYDLFAGRAIRRLGGRNAEFPYRSVRLKLANEIKSARGRVDYLRMKVKGDFVEPIGGGASILSSTVAADGFALIDSETEKLDPGEMANVWLYMT